VKALSIRQPWAELILRGRKIYEIRPRTTRERGRIWIHAGLVFEMRSVEQAGLAMPDLVRGALVGTVEIVDCVPFTQEIAEEMRAVGGYFGTWSPGGYAWAVTNPQRLATPVPWRGQLGLFSIPPDVEDAASFVPSL
jgi:hypothetical protein